MILLPLIRLAFAAALCSVEATPKVALPPLRTVRLRVKVEPQESWRTASVTLYDPNGLEMRTSQVWDQSGGAKAARTTQIEWFALPPAEPGIYTVVLTVTTPRKDWGCQAQDRIMVGVEPEGPQ